MDNSGSLVNRSLRLRPEPEAARIARSFVRGEVSAAPDDVRDAAVLLASELVTNALVHGGSAIELEVDQADGAVTIRVTDADTGPVVVRPSGRSELDEGGRGIVLIDRLSEAWGTEHAHGRKCVWFRVAGSSTGPAPAERAAKDDRSMTPELVAEAPGAADAATLARLLLPPKLATAMTFPEHVGELLLRILDAVGARGAAVRYGAGADDLVARGAVSGDAAVTRQLVVGDRSTGVLEVYGDVPETAAPYLSLAADRLALLLAEHGMLAAETARGLEVGFLGDATELLAQSVSVAQALTLLTQVVVPRLGQWCAAYAVDERGHARRLLVNAEREERLDALTRVLDGDRDVAAIIATATEGGSTPLALPSVVPVAGQRSYVTAVPLRTRAHTHGVLLLGRSSPLDPVTSGAVAELARRAALAVDNARLHEERSATVHALQASLLPSALPSVPGVQFAARYHSASVGVAVGGDFYDAFTLADGRIVVAIGDVCGKGAEAAAVTGMTRDLLRVLMHDGASPAGALRRLNQALLEHPTASRFCTVAVALLAVTPEGLRGPLCLAGHPEPALVGPAGAARMIGACGELLGVLDTEVLELPETEITVGPGESLVFYTDGVTERRDPSRMFGQAGVLDALRVPGPASADTLAESLEQAARSFVRSELRDDLAILVVTNTTS